MHDTKWRRFENKSPNSLQKRKQEHGKSPILRKRRKRRPKITPSTNTDKRERKRCRRMRVKKLRAGRISEVE